MKFYETKDFKTTHKDWKEKLEKDGFKDVEARSLQSLNTRSISFQDQTNIRDFFLMLDCLLTHHTEMTQFERKVLLMYSSGTHLTDIYKTFKFSKRHVRTTIDRYKKLVIALMKMKVNGTFT